MTTMCRMREFLRRGIRILLVCLVVEVFACHAVPARGSSAPAGSEVEVSTADIDALIAILEKKETRAAFIKKLAALRDAQEAGEATRQVGLGGDVMAAVSAGIAELGATLLHAGEWLGNPGRLVDWVRNQARDPARRTFWSFAMLTVVLVLAAGLGAQLLLRWFLSRPRRAIESRPVANQLIRIRLLLSRTLLDIIPIVGFGVISYATLAAMQPQKSVRLVVLAVVNAVVVSRAILAFARLVITPLAPSLRLFRLADTTAAYAYVWTTRFVHVVVYGYFLAESALLLEIPPGGRIALVNLFGLVATAMTLVLVLQLRERVASAIRGARFGAGRGRGIRRWLGDTWHILAIFYIVAAYVAWVVDVSGGFVVMVRGTVGTVLAVAVAYALIGLANRSVRRLFRVAPELRERFTDLQERVDRYQPVVRTLLATLIAVSAALASMEAWGLHAVGFFASDIGRDLLTRLFHIGMILLLAALAWEVTRIAVAHYLDANSTGNGRSQRARTLLPLARSALLILIAAMAAMSVLAEIGVNIGPLLAGAGIIGLAIGFGAQTLVKDVITGAFILMEDAIAVGDIVELGGQLGEVEAISIRSVRHRDLSGTVHTIPFSSVDVVRNHSKGYSYYLMDIGVAYRESTDEVVAVVREVLEGMRGEPEFGPSILEPLDVMGVQEFADSAVLIRARIKTRPGQQWRIGREFNRRMKYAFDERGIEIPFPHRTIYFGVDKEGDAPPARVKTEVVGDR